MDKNLSKQVAATYRTLRLGLAVLAFAFPPLLFGGGLLIWHLPLAHSLSAYYHYHIKEPLSSEKAILAQGAADKEPSGQGVLRDVFVGILFAVGALLFAYQGFTRLEDYALNLAGVLAWGIALFPMAWPEGSTSGGFSLHGTVAVSFFIAIAYVCIFRAGDTLPLIENETTRKHYLVTYRFLGVAMVAFPLLAWALISLTPWKSATFFAELAGIYVFATYWVIKSHEASKSRVDEEASCGRLHVRPHGLSDMLRQLPVTPVQTRTHQQE